MTGEEDSYGEPLILRGRAFSVRDQLSIAAIAEQYYRYGRTRISVEVCRQLNWRQPNGWLKDRACRDVLRELEKRELIALPRIKSNPIGNSNRGAEASGGACPVDKTELTALCFKSVSLEQAKGGAKERQWNALVRDYHYRGFRVSVGRTLKYLILHEQRIIGAISFSDPAWKLKPRDDLIESLGLSPAEIKDQVISNSRFLILPWVRVKNLASYALASACSRVANDWYAYYAVRPQFIETFVDARFKGTCYRAANWAHIGTTAGYRKCGSFHSNSQEPKDIFLFATGRRHRRQLLTKCQGTGSHGISK